MQRWLSDSLWQGWAQGETEPFQELVPAPWDYQYANHDTCSGWGGGQLGYFTADGSSTIDPDLSLHGQSTWVCSGGSSLFVTYEGRIIITEDRDFPYLFTAVLTAKGGTGRFANATGSANMNGKFSGTLRNFYFNFEGTLDTQGNFHEFGKIELESLACLKGQIVPYTMEAWNWKPFVALPRHSGSIMPTSQPIMVESTPDMTVWTFSAEQGPNWDFFGLPIHVMTMDDGLILCRWQAECRVEIDHNNDDAARLWFDGLFTVIDGTDRYQGAQGTWQMQFAAEDRVGDDPIWSLYMINGTLQVDPIKSNARALFPFRNKK